MGKCKFSQNEGKMLEQPKEQREEAPTKGNDDGKEGDAVCKHEEHRQVRKKRTRITEVERLVIDVGAQVNPTKCRAAAVEQKRQRTKIAQHKGRKKTEGSMKDAKEEPPPASSFLVHDVVKIMGCGVGEEGRVVAHGKVINVKGGIVHGVSIYAGCVSAEVKCCEDDDYVLFKSVETDDPPIRKMRELVGNIILWPTEFLLHG